MPDIRLYNYNRIENRTEGGFLYIRFKTTTIPKYNIYESRNHIVEHNTRKRKRKKGVMKNRCKIIPFQNRLRTKHKHKREHSNLPSPRARILLKFLTYIIPLVYPLHLMVAFAFLFSSKVHGPKVGQH